MPLNAVKVFSFSGLIENPIYGFRANQAIVNGLRATGLSLDDHIFLRPSPSEVIMREFGDILMVRSGKIVGVYPAFPQQRGQLLSHNLQ